MNILTRIQNHPFFATLAAIIAATGVATGVALAWGPERPTFTIDNPADYVTFNSITDNPVVGDERDFVSVKDATNTQAGGWHDTITAEPGKEYLVRIYVHNNAGASLNLSAVNTRVQAAIGTNTDTKVGLTGYVSADNAKPQRVYDDVNFTANKKFNLAYVPGSAMLYNNITGQAGRAVSDSIVDGSGAQIGYESNDGKVPGCFQYVSYITFKVKPQFAPKADFTMEKNVRKQGDSAWKNNIDVNAGDTIQYRVLFQNTSDVQLDNVMIFDTLPQGVTYVNGSTKLYLGSDPKNARQMPDGITDKNKGLNIGSYGKNGLASIIFDAKVASNDKLPECGVNTMKNVARVETNYGKKDDDATIKVEKKCKPTPEDKTIKVCRLSDKKYPVEIKESEFDASKHSKNPEDCKDKPQPEKIKVCDTTNNSIVTIDRSTYENNTGRYTDDLSKCSVTPTPETPTTPSELPKTGTSDTFISLLGLGGLTYAAVMYIASRRS